MRRLICRRSSPLSARSLEKAACSFLERAEEATAAHTIPCKPGFELQNDLAIWAMHGLQHVPYIWALLKSSQEKGRGGHTRPPTGEGGGGGAGARGQGGGQGGSPSPRPASTALLKSCNRELPGIQSECVQTLCLQTLGSTVQPHKTYAGQDFLSFCCHQQVGIRLTRP